MTDIVKPQRLDTLANVVNSPEQKTAALWQKASDIFKTASENVLERVTVGEHHYVLTPTYTQGQWPHQGDGLKTFNGHTFAVAAIVEAGQKTYRGQSGNPLLLVIDGNINRSLLQFNAYGDGLVVLDGSGTTLKDDSLNKIVANIASETKLRMQKQREVRGKRHNVYKGVGAAVAVLAAAGGVYEGQDTYFEHRDIKAHKKVAQYDANHSDLLATPIKVGDTGYALSAPNFFETFIPKQSNNDIQGNPRLTSIKAGTCRNIGSIGTERSISIVTSGPSEEVVAFISGAGSVNVCAMPQANNNSSQPEYKLAVQEK